MITLILSSLYGSNLMEVFGYVLMALECLLVVTKFLSLLVNPKGKFGLFLKKLLKGLKFLKDEVKEHRNESENVDHDVKN